MTRAIVVAFHKYQNYGGRYYQPILDFFLRTMKKYQNEFNKFYILDSTWDIKDDKKVKELGGEVIKVDPSLRYYDAYKAVLPQIKEDLVLFMDNDMVIYKPGVIQFAFSLLSLPMEVDDYDVISITDTIGTMKVPLKTGNKLCPYFFATRKDLLMKYLDIDWAPQMPYTETFGLLTEALLKDGARVYEMEDDKSNILLNSQEHGTLMEYDKNNGQMKSKDLGYYHIRAGSTPALLLAYKEHDPDKYWEYLKNQPKSEYLRQFAWYQYMIENTKSSKEEARRLFLSIWRFLVEDLKLSTDDWDNYFNKFEEYHGLWRKI